MPVARSANLTLHVETAEGAGCRSPRSCRGAGLKQTHSVWLQHLARQQHRVERFAATAPQLAAHPATMAMTGLGSRRICGAGKGSKATLSLHRILSGTQHLACRHALQLPWLHGHKLRCCSLGAAALAHRRAGSTPAAPACQHNHTHSCTRLPLPSLPASAGPAR